MSEARYAQILTEIDISNKRREAFEREGQFRGRHILDWIPELDRLRTEKRDDEALELLWEIVPISDRAYRAWGEAAGGWAEKRIAVILRRRKMYADEVAVLEGFLARNPGHQAREIRTRLEKARLLLAQSRRSDSE